MRPFRSPLRHLPILVILLLLLPPGAADTAAQVDPLQAGTTTVPTESATAVPSEEPDDAVVATAPVTITTNNNGDLYFDPKEVTIPANTDVTVTLRNEGTLAHTFSIGGQGEAAACADIVAARVGVASLAGPSSGTLEQGQGTFTFANAGITAEDFSATTTFLNPPETSAGPWQYGFAFRERADGTEVEQILVDSTGMWHHISYPAGIQQSGEATGLDTAPGGANTLDLVVRGETATVCVNGQSAGTVDLPPAVASDVYAVGVFAGGSAEDKSAIAYRDFQVWPAPGAAEQGPETEPAAELPEAFIGHWEGISDELPTNLRTPVSIDLTGGSTGAVVGTHELITPSGTPCGGDLLLQRIAADGRQIELAAEITFGQTLCIPGGIITLSLQTDGALTYDWHHPTIRVTATGTLSRTGSEAAELPVAFLGHWEGPADDVEAGYESMVTIELSGGSAGEVVGTIDYPVAGDRAVACGGNLELRSVAADGRRVELVDKLTYGMETCVFLDGTVTLDLQADGSLAYRWTQPNYPGSLTGTLTRPVATPVPSVVSPSQEEAPADRFAAALAASTGTPSLTSPQSGTLALRCCEDVAAGAAVSVADFMATASFVAPDNLVGNPQGVGFEFRRTGDMAERLRIGWDGTWNYWPVPEGNVRSGNTQLAGVPLAITPGTTITVELVVEGERALFGVDGQFVAEIALLHPVVAGDVSVIQFWSNGSVEGVEVAYADFQVWAYSPLAVQTAGAEEPTSDQQSRQTEVTTADLPATFVGRWKGTTNQRPQNYDYPVTIDLTGGSVGEVVGAMGLDLRPVETPPCGGDLTLQRVAADGRQVQLSLFITHDPMGETGGCMENPLITLSAQTDGTLAYDLSHVASPVTATGTLARINSPPEAQVDPNSDLPSPTEGSELKPASDVTVPTDGVEPEPSFAVSAPDAERFAALLATQRQVAPLAGPFRANLKERATSIDIAFANVNLADFHASAVVTVPLQTSAVPWDTGFRFRVPQGDVRVTVSSLGVWSLASGVDAPSATGPVPNLVTTPGGTNVLDLFVAGQRAWLGVNETFVASIALPPGDAGDVELGAGFFLDEIVDGRVTSFRGFVIRPLDPGALESTMPGGAADMLPADFVGHWVGTATWDDATLPVAMELREGSVGEVVGTIEYALYDSNGPKCGGDVSLDEVTSDGQQIELSGTITYDAGACLIDAEVTVALHADGTFSYEWRHPLFDVTGSGTLTRTVQPKS